MSTSALALIVDNGFRKSWRSDAISGSLPVSSRQGVVRFMRSFRHVCVRARSKILELAKCPRAAESKKTCTAPSSHQWRFSLIQALGYIRNRLTNFRSGLD